MKKQLNKKPAKKISAIQNECIELQIGSINTENKLSNPYVIYIENNFKIKQKVILFGDAVFGYEKNFGSEEGVKITTNGRGYAHLLKQSAYNPFEIGKWRIQSENMQNANQELIVNCVDANGVEVRSKINLAIMRDAYQYQPDILDISKIKYVNHNIYFELELQPRTGMTISLFPIKIYNLIEYENGVKLNAQRLSGKNTTPVIIQTSSKIKAGSKKPLSAKDKSTVSRKK